MRAFVLTIILLVSGLPTFGQIHSPSFEGPGVSAWRGPLGGGLLGGKGGGGIMDRENGLFVRSGERAACLKVWDHGTTNAVAWSSLSQTMACEPLRRLRAEAWMLSSPTHWPLAPAGTVAHLRVEYFSDDAGRYVIPTHAVMSEPFPLAAGRGDETWQKVEVTDRIPPGARSCTVSVVLMTETPGHHPQAIWVDDISMEMLARR